MHTRLLRRASQRDRRFVPNCAVRSKGVLAKRAELAAYRVSYPTQTREFEPELVGNVKNRHKHATAERQVPPLRLECALSQQGLSPNVSVC